MLAAAAEPRPSAAGHRGAFDRRRAERRHQPLRNADQTGRREHDEADEQQAETEQPVRRQIDRNSRNRMKNSAPSAGPRKLRMPPITTMARSSPEKATEIGSAEVMRLLKSESVPASAGDRRRQHEGDQLVAVGRIAEEARALLVLADRHQHAADRRTVEAPEQDADRDADRGDEPIIIRVTLEIDAEHGRRA